MKCCEYRLCFKNNYFIRPCCKCLSNSKLPQRIYLSYLINFVLLLKIFIRSSLRLKLQKEVPLMRKSAVKCGNKAPPLVRWQYQGSLTEGEGSVQLTSLY
jgi:hypothetical protein